MPIGEIFQRSKLLGGEPYLQHLLIKCNQTTDAALDTG